MKKNEIQDQSIDELKALYRDLSKEIFDLKNENALNRKLEKPHLLRSKKRDRARALTEINKKSAV